jgi:hypothetical protein
MAKAQSKDLINEMAIFISFPSSERFPDIIKTQGQKSVLKSEKSTDEAHFVWHEAGGQMRKVVLSPRACTRATATERGTYILMHKYGHSNFSANNKMAMRKLSN